MARQLTSTPDEVHVLYTAAEAEGFRRGWALLPDAGRDEPLARAVRRTLQALAFEFAPQGECVEVRVEPLVPRDVPAAGAPREWYVVRFHLASGSDEERHVLARWLAEHAPRLAFAIETTEPATATRA